jgi:hypothetical protein
VTIHYDPGSNKTIVIGPYGATLPYVNVEINEGGMGTASPRGQLTGTIKQNIPFTLNYAAKAEYPFTGWQALVDGMIIASRKEGTPAVVEGTNKVTWEPVNISGTETRVTIHYDPGSNKTIVIGPYGATLPYVNVEINEEGMGTASPRGQLAGIKKDIPFTLNYSSFSEYGFLGWEAVLAAAPNAVLGQNKVEFSPVDKPETTVTVKMNPGNDWIIIRPVGGLAPVVASISPDMAGKIRPVKTDQVIRIRFSRPMDPDSFLFEENNWLPFKGDWRAAYYPEDYGDQTNIGGYDNRVYKNILIESNNVLAGLDSNNWAPFYYPPELSDDGTILTITFRRDVGNSDFAGEYNQLTVTLNRDIRDTRGISLGRTYPFVIEARESTNHRSSPTDDDPPYPEILNGSKFAMVKASPPDTAHPDGQIWPGARIFGTEVGDSIIFENGSYSDGPSSEPSHHFAYDRDDNWIYIVFQTELSDYAFAGALIYENYTNSSSNETYSYTGQTASPVYDPAVVKPLTDFFKERHSNYAASSYNFNPSRPIRVVKYNLSRQTAANFGSEKPHVVLRIAPLDILDQPKDSDDDVLVVKKDVTTALTEADLFEGGSSKDIENIELRVHYLSPFIGVWYVAD